MIKTFIKHTLLEHCITVMYDHIYNNFTTSVVISKIECQMLISKIECQLQAMSNAMTISSDTTIHSDKYNEDLMYLQNKIAHII